MLKPGLLILITATMLAALLISAFDFLRFTREPLRVETELTVQIEAGMTQNRLFGQWVSAGYIRHPRDRYWLRLVQELDEQHSPHIQAGEYLLRPGRSLIESLTPLQRGDVVQRDLTIIEGWTFAQLREALRQTKDLKQTLSDLDEAAVMAAIGRAGVHPEGRFLPETYAWVRGQSDRDILIRAARAMDEALAQAWRAREEGLPLSTAEDLLVLASIIEKETAVIDEMPLIAGVFIRRLEIGMRLQTDPTVIYGLGERFDGNLRRVDLRTDTPYNTYTRHGLPPTPIAMPGLSALKAAGRPQRSDKLYFVSRGDGTHVFSATLKEHEAAVRQYQLKGR